MIRWITYAMVYLGSALMIYNIYGFVRFARYIQSIKTWDRGNRIIYIPILLLVCFLLGYLIVAIFGKPDIVIAGILFGGSIFVYAMYKLLGSIVQKVMKAERLEAALMAAEESSRAKSSFLASISHEMRTPMNVILGMNALALKNPGLPDPARDQMEKSSHSARYLSGLIDNLLTMQEAENGSLVIRREPFSLKESLEQLSAQISVACEQKGLEYQTSYAKCIGRDFIGDATELKRALMCILDNAVKYTDAPGTVRFCVKCVKDRDASTNVRFIISDTGVGIDEPFLEKIFDPLTQEDPSFTNRFGGTGMGLTVANSIVTHMGGKIEVVSRKGEGSTFTISVPIVPVPNEVCATCDGCKPEQHMDCANCGICKLGQTAPEEDPDKNASGCLAGRRILIVDDIDENAEIVADLLELENAESERAENGQEAVNMVKLSPEFYYDAILMDIRMPMMDGYEATRRIRALERGDAQKIPIIAVSANAFDSDVRNALEAGMNEHLSKPVDADLLYETIRRYMPR